MVAALLVFATPTMAAMLVQNFMQAEIEAAAPCFNKSAGSDAGLLFGGTPIAGFDDTTTFVSPEGVTLTQETLSLTGMRGDRTVFTDIVHYNNLCDFPITVQLVQATSSNWNGAAVELWLSNVGTPGTDLTDAAGTGPDDWNDTYIVIDSAGAVAPTSTGTVVIPAGGTIQGGIVIETPAAAAIGSTVGTINWIAQASA